MTSPNDLVRLQRWRMLARQTIGLADLRSAIGPVAYPEPGIAILAVIWLEGVWKYSFFGKNSFLSQNGRPMAFAEDTSTLKGHLSAIT